MGNCALTWQQTIPVSSFGAPYISPILIVLDLFFFFVRQDQKELVFVLSEEELGVQHKEEISIASSA